MIECLRQCNDIEEAFFLIIGDGTEYHLLEEYVKQEKPKNLKIMKKLPKDDYDSMVGACDVGLIFLDYRFTIPNFPSRLLAYMDMGKPVLAIVDENTDIGKVILDGKFGWTCSSDNCDGVITLIENILQEENLNILGKNSRNYLIQNFDVERAYNIIVKCVN